MRSYLRCHGNASRKTYMDFSFKYSTLLKLATNFWWALVHITASAKELKWKFFLILKIDRCSHYPHFLVVEIAHNKPEIKTSQICRQGHTAGKPSKDGAQVISNRLYISHRWESWPYRESSLMVNFFYCVTPAAHKGGPGMFPGGHSVPGNQRSESECSQFKFSAQSQV